MNKAVYPVFLAFLCMGFGDVVSPMVSLAKESFQLSNFSAQLLPFVGFIMFFVLAIPVGIFQDRNSKKSALLVGMLIAFLGLIIPIIAGMYGVSANFQANQFNFVILLISIFMLGAGATVLQVSGNPVMRDVSSEGRFSSNLSLGQSIKAIGSSLGFLLPPAVAVAFNMDWTILFPIYAALIFITSLWIYSIKIPEKRDTDAGTTSFASCVKLLANPYVLMMVFGIFVYVGAEVSMSSQVPLLMKEKFGIETLGLVFAWALFFLPIFLGRLVGSAILRFMKAPVFLVISVLMGLLGLIMMLLGGQYLTFAGIVIVGLGFSNIFPLIFSITIDRMPRFTNELSALMVMAIVGGGILPLFAGSIADNFGILLSFIVPLAAVIYLIFIAFTTVKAQK
jgi:fucose permease